MYIYTRKNNRTNIELFRINHFPHLYLRNIMIIILFVVLNYQCLNRSSVKELLVFLAGGFITSSPVGPIFDSFD